VITNDDDAIPLKEAAERYGFTVSTLRAEAYRGRLTIYKIGKRLWTKPADIREMVEKCRVEQKARDFILIRNESSGSSATDRASSALAAANETVLRLKSISRNTSAKSTSPKRQAHR
jgi:hypothetical protein